MIIALPRGTNAHWVHLSWFLKNPKHIIIKNQVIIISKYTDDIAVVVVNEDVAAESLIYFHCKNNEKSEIQDIVTNIEL